LKCAQIIAYIYIIVNFQLRSSIIAGLTERSLYNRFCIERSAKKIFGRRDFGGGAKIFGGNPLATSFGEKHYGYALNTLVSTRGKVITKKHKKRNVCAVRVTFHPCALLTLLTPLNPQLPRCACGVLWAT